ncbi:preprotein translocase subunit SecA [Spinactinospora alkalitolerans]|uniref:Protein translocase subunit SecA n=1 Tax=Spinactinospora alkalitolerans TaxID=687207 RepID=A0A852U062_9ACTN|nr:preprotein translocase subunit SecA [Spinactinospora alkalitolerans]NYE49639.1 preprotein translocase subunit SecA [Spinactinospora alkalitolerans]
MPGILDKVLRAGEGKILRKLKRLKDQINSIEDDFVDLSDAELRELTDEYKQRLEDGETLEDLLPEAFATVREAAKRTLGQRPFDVQLMGGAALHFGNIAEMKTGEGKTLTAALAVYLNALAGQGVHVVTVNDYLARRDAENMGRIYRFLGLEVGVIVPDMSAADRRKAYQADVTHGTNNEFGFDYLRDNMALSSKDRVQREHNFAIVDEVDSILIDEARTPLIISGPAEQNSRWYSEFAKIAPRLRRETDYEVDEKKRTVGITESGVEKVEDWLGIENLYESVNTPLISFLNNSLKAKELYRRDKEYIVKDGEVLIVDEFTGRVLRGRRYNEGMHQAIEAKEKVRIKDENQTLAKVTLQNYFRLYEKLSGMTGTATTEAAEFNQTYGIGVVPIPTNKPMIRDDERDVVYKNEDAKFLAVVDDIAECYEAGQPVLVGTTSVEKSELLSKLLKQRGVDHEVLNAKNHAREASIVARAGKLKGVTVATNMAGRGTDIMLGGNPDFIADEELHARGLSPLETPEEYEAAWPEALEKAQKAFENEHEEVVEVGGLYVLGTERHESRRIDNQLRGRSGRQGDPGRSRFYLSLEDDLMRLFNSARVEIIMERLNIPEDQPIESGVVSKAIQSAQGQVEQQNFEIRKNVLKYDEVLNRQRKVIYAERGKVLEGADLKEQVESMIDDVLDSYVRVATAEGDPEDWDLDKLWKAFKQVYPIDFTADELIEENGGELSSLTPELIGHRVREDAHAAYERREEELGAETMREVERRVILQVMDRKWREHLYEMDYLQEGIGLRAMAQRNPLIEYQREGYDMFQEMLEGIKEESVGFLFNVDVQVKDKPGTVTASGAAATATAAPVVTTAEEEPRAAEQPAAEEAETTEEAEEKASAKAEGKSEDETPDVVVQGFGADRPSRLQYSAPDETGGVERHTESTDDDYANTPRNAPCPCGSGKKFKRCHGDPKNRA